MNQKNINNPKVSVIMPVYNGASYISSAIESVLQQTYKNLELIIINDGSVDNSEHIIKEFNHDERVLYLSNESNCGVAKSRNIAISKASGQFIAFLDQDDIWLPKKLEIQISIYAKFPHLGLLHSKYARIDENGDIIKNMSGVVNSDFENPDAPVDIRNVFEEIFIRGC